MKQAMVFTGVYVFGCVSVLAFALVVNLLGNASKAFPSPLFPTFSERAWKSRRLEDAVRECRPPRIIILGSSRVMQIQPAYIQAITRKPTFNYGVSMATPTDYLTQLRYLLRMGCRPDAILLGIDESAFRYEYGKPWGMETLGHFGLFKAVPFPENLDILGSALRSINLNTTRESVAALLRAKQAAARKIEDVDNILLEDGYLIYCNHVKRIDEGSFDQAANIAVDLRRQDTISVLQDALLRPNARKFHQLEEFLSLTKAEGIEVRVMLLPVHPDYERQRFTEALLQARSALSHKIQSLCMNYGATYRDFTDLASFDGDPNEFYDAVHQTPTNTRKMVNVLFGFRAQDVAADLPSDSQILSDLPAVTTLTTE